MTKARRPQAREWRVNMWRSGTVLWGASQIIPNFLQIFGFEPLLFARNLPFLAGTAAAYGLEKEEALKLITYNTAKILGIDNITGTLETGKDANLFVSNGDVLNILTNNVELIFLKGKQVSIQNHQTELYQKYLSKYNLK